MSGMTDVCVVTIHRPGVPPHVGPFVKFDCQDCEQTDLYSLDYIVANGTAGLTCSQCGSTRYGAPRSITSQEGNR